MNLQRLCSGVCGFCRTVSSGSVVPDENQLPETNHSGMVTSVPSEPNDPATLPA